MIKSPIDSRFLISISEMILNIKGNRITVDHTLTLVITMGWGGCMSAFLLARRRVIISI